MADLQRTIEILFTATNRTGSVIGSVGSELDGLNANVTAIARPLSDLSTAVVKLDAALAAMAAAGLAYAFNESSKLQSAFTELKKVAGDNAEALDAAKVNAKSLSNTYGEASSEILASTANFVQAGFSIEQSMQLAKTGMDLVIAGGVDASQSSEILIASLKGFKAPAEDAGRLLDILNEVSNRYATDIEQLGIGMAGISPIARTMGFSMEETAGLLTPVIEIFRSGNEASVALKTGLLKLIDDSKPVREALESIGVSQKTANGELRSGKDILFDVANAFKTLDQDQKLFVTQQLVGIEQSARMVEVFDGLGKSTEITAVAMNAVGSAAKEVAVRLKDPEVAIDRLITGFKNLASSIGDDFQNAGVNAIDGITDILNILETQVDAGAFDPLLDALNDFLEGIGETFEEIARNLPEALEGVDYSGFLDALGGIKDTIGGLFDGIDVGDTDSLREGIQRVVDSFESLARFSGGLAEIFVAVAGKIGDLIGWFNSLDGSTKTTAANVAGIGAAVTVISVPIAALSSAITGLGGVFNILATGHIAKLVASLVGPTGSLTAALAVVQAHPLIAAGAAGLAIGTAWRAMVPEVDAAAQSVLQFIDKYTGVFGIEEEHQRIQKEGIAIDQRWKAIMDERADAAEAAATRGYEGNLALVNSLEAGADSTDELTEKMRALGILVEEEKTVNLDTAEAQEKLQALEYWRESTGTWETIMVPVDISEIDKAKAAIDDIPAVKRFELETDLHIEEIKANAATLQTALQVRAQVDIADIEAATQRIVALSGNITEMFQNTGDVIGDLFSSLGDADNTGQRYNIERAIDQEQERRDKALEMQEKLTESQIKNLDARTEKLQSGEALITINGDGLAPELEMMMWKVFEAIHIRATQEGLDQLLLGGA